MGIPDTQGTPAPGHCINTRKCTAIPGYPNMTIEAAMCKESEFLDAFGGLDHGAVRAHFLRTGKLEGLVKGDVVYIDWYGRWERVRLIRRIPGDCWIAALLFSHPFCSKTTVSVTNFGGKAVK